MKNILQFLVKFHLFVVEERFMFMSKQKCPYSRINDIKNDCKHKPQKRGSAEKKN